MNINSWLMLIFVVLIIFSIGITMILIARKRNAKQLESTGVTLIAATAILSLLAAVVSFINYKGSFF